MLHSKGEINPLIGYRAGSKFPFPQFSFFTSSSSLFPLSKNDVPLSLSLSIFLQIFLSLSLSTTLSTIFLFSLKIFNYFPLMCTPPLLQPLPLFSSPLLSFSLSLLNTLINLIISPSLTPSFSYFFLLNTPFAGTLNPRLSHFLFLQVILISFLIRKQNYRDLEKFTIRNERFCEKARQKSVLFCLHFEFFFLSLFLTIPLFIFSLSIAYYLLISCIQHPLSFSVVSIFFLHLFSSSLLFNSHSNFDRSVVDMLSVREILRKNKIKTIYY